MINHRVSSKWSLQFLSDMRHDVMISSTAVRSLDQDVNMLHDKQLMVSAAMENIHNAILSRAASTFSEMEKINNTAYSIGSRFELLSRRSYWSFVEDLIYRILSYICQGSFLPFSHIKLDNIVLVDPQDLDQARYSRVCQIVAKVFSSVLHILLSAIAVIAPFMSIRRHLTLRDRVSLFLSTLPESICIGFSLALTTDQSLSALTTHLKASLN